MTSNNTTKTLNEADKKNSLQGYVTSDAETVFMAVVCAILVLAIIGVSVWGFLTYIM